jgi:capsule polysaccharide export protein KpsC/LpsZ
VLLQVISRIVEGCKLNLINRIGNALINQANQQIEFIKQNKISKQIQPNRNGGISPANKKFNSPLVQFSETENRINYKYTQLKSDAEALANQYANFRATAILTAFEDKLVRKLQPILTSNPNIKNIHLLSLTMCNDIDIELFFQWETKQFTVNTSIVLDNNQDDFAKFPLNFCNAKLSDNSKMGKPSLAVMIEYFK